MVRTYWRAVVVDAVMTAQLLIADPSELSLTAYSLTPQRSVKLFAVSTPSPGIENVAVAVEPSYTEIEVGSKVIPVIVVAKQGLVTSTVMETSEGENEVEDWPEEVTVMVLVRATV